MQRPSSAPYRPHDAGRVPLTSPAPPADPPQHLRSAAQPAPDFLIVGLFALRLAKQLIQGLDRYPGRETDLAWLEHFLSAYHVDYALAKISGPRRDNYVVTYRNIVSRMKRQPRYPVRFMEMNPDLSAQWHQSRREEYERGMSDAERLAVINFSDAAGEWGSTVSIPAREADRMIELADQRRVADLDSRPESGAGREPSYYVA
ncbi:hypothetical protein IAQ61_007805 [Plenodomus lingam]|uniref:Uncharacterized protein n=1 Tax=Leptosphaeria maculans (strain JN3 / isolate v23.1.3 / race Av1-4-5-6-7-8) TaxID=985895 RepID=E5A4M0_LEPMJ|nr:hypothetical protein LEMA_P078070.1 [Plenodomus lingam JN3]KAH9867213.1 hypothetical protein IAQ61_007805 [Plenodomus lingam]CBX98568.1 hypothetical protein LEMA_P078070.1 [Plenodomus lingam JN3]